MRVNVRNTTFDIITIDPLTTRQLANKMMYMTLLQ